MPTAREALGRVAVRTAEPVLGLARLVRLDRDAFAARTPVRAKFPFDALPTLPFTRLGSVSASIITAVIFFAPGFNLITYESVAGFLPPAR